jgi:ATP/maltotriose-dependent transcriptional regulator MalT
MFTCVGYSPSKVFAFDQKSCSSNFMQSSAIYDQIKEKLDRLANTILAIEEENINNNTKTFVPAIPMVDNVANDASYLNLILIMRMSGKFEKAASEKLDVMINFLLKKNYRNINMAILSLSWPIKKTDNMTYKSQLIEIDKNLKEIQIKNKDCSG